MVENICAITRFMQSSQISNYGSEFLASIRIFQKDNLCYENELECYFSKSYKYDNVELSITWSNVEYITIKLGLPNYFSAKRDTFSFVDGSLVIKAKQYTLLITKTT